MIRLGQLLTYLSRIEVSEIVVGSGRPVTIRSAGAYKPLTSAPVTTGQIMELIKGTDLESLIPAQDSSGSPRDISLGGGTYRATVARRGDALFVKIERSEEALARETERVPIDRPRSVVERNTTQNRDPEARDRGPQSGRTQPLHMTPPPASPTHRSAPITPSHGMSPLTVQPAGSTAPGGGATFGRAGSSSGAHDLRTIPRGSTPEQSVPGSSPGIVIAHGPRLAPPFARTVPDLFVALVREARRRGATDLHVAAGQPPLLRTVGQLHPGNTPLDATEVAALLEPMLSPAELAALHERGYVDIGIDVRDPQFRTTSRVRANISKARNGMRGAFRLIWEGVPTLDALNLPADLGRVTNFHQGLVIIAGPSGHGKTTTMAALVDLINAARPHHILCIEDPIEVVHPRKAAVVSQRAVGTHTLSFGAALKASLREDPDVIVIGEVRDRETVEIALTASETGHLVICTMSTPSAAKTIDRMIDMFPPDDQQQVRVSLAAALKIIVTQRLVPTRGGDRLVPAVELLTGVLPVVALIRENKLFQLPSVQQRGRAFGMIRFDDSLLELVRDGTIDEATALATAEHPKEMLTQLRSPPPPTEPPRTGTTTQKMGFFKRKGTE